MENLIILAILISIIAIGTKFRVKQCYKKMGIDIDKEEKRKVYTEEEYAKERMLRRIEEDNRNQYSALNSQIRR
ncbi:MAG: hypothetical protein RR594_07185 [Clostridia bacterium]